MAVGGEEQKAHFLCMDLPQSDDCFVMAFPAENTESFLEGHHQAFTYFGGVPRTILYDNTKIEVKEILGDGERKPTQAFSELQSHACSRSSSGGREKATTKGTWRGWWVTPGGTSWCRYREWPVGGVLAGGVPPASGSQAAGETPPVARDAVRNLRKTDHSSEFPGAGAV